MFTSYSKEELKRMVGAAEHVSETMRVLQKSDSNIVGEILNTSENFYEWEHLPPEDVYDRQSHSQYYYHAHSKSEDGSGLHDDEHGHFHTFIRGKAMPDGIAPLTLPDYDPKTDISDINTHIIGIGMNEMGVPIRLFTVNRWVTDETWIRAEDVIALLEQYEIDHTEPSWPLNLWISNMVVLFRPLIETLVAERDQAVEAWKKAHPDVENVYEDRGLEVTSHQDINLAQYVDELLSALESV